MNHNQPLGDRYSKFINALLFIFPVFISSTKGFGDLILFVLAICGLVIAILQKTSPFSIPSLRLFSWLCLFYFIMVCLSVLFSGNSSDLARYINRELHFLFAPLIGLAIYKANINRAHLLLGINAALVVLGVIALIKYDSGVIRPSGVMNADVYGQLAATLTAVSLVGFLRKGLPLIIFSMLSFALGMTAIVLSGTRGSWLSLLLCFIVFLLLFFIKTSDKKNKILAVMFVVASIVLAAITDTVQDRVSLSYSQYSEWSQGVKTPNSVSIRLEMYSAGLRAIPDTPFFGHGYRNAVANITHADESFQKAASGFNHLHNAYLSMFFYSGIFGLLSLVLLFLAPLMHFLQSIRSNNFIHENIMGVMLVVSTAATGITSVVFGDPNINGLYILFLAYLLPFSIKGRAS